MKNTWKKTTMAALMLTLALGSGGSAFAQTPDGQTGGTEPNTASEVTAPALTASKLNVVRIAPAMGLLSGPAHEQQYLKMLVKTYAPESEAEWTEAMNERKQVQQSLPQTLTLKKASAVGGEDQPSDKSEPVLFINKVTAADAVPALKAETISAGEAVQIEEGKTMKRIILPKTSAAADDIIKKDMETFQAQLKLQNDLANALEADDADQVKTLLPQLLEQYKGQTAEMKKISELSSTKAEETGE